MMEVKQAFAFRKTIKNFDIKESIEVIGHPKYIDIRKTYKYGRNDGYHSMDMSVETAKKLRDSLILILERLDKFDKDG